MSGGVPPYLGAWADPVTLDVIASGLVANGLSAGAYGFGVMDLAGCTLDTVIMLEAPDALSLAVSATAPTCFGDNNGEAEAVVSGGTPGYTVSWTGSVPLTLGLALSDLGPGAYQATVTDDNGCMADTAFTLVEPEALGLNITAIPVGCTGTDGRLDAGVTGGSPDYALTWTGPSGPAGNADTLVGVPPGAYTLDVVDAKRRRRPLKWGSCPRSNGPCRGPWSIAKPAWAPWPGRRVVEKRLWCPP